MNFDLPPPPNAPSSSLSPKEISGKRAHDPNPPPCMTCIGGGGLMTQSPTPL